MVIYYLILYLIFNITHFLLYAISQIRLDQEAVSYNHFRHFDHREKSLRKISKNI